MKRLWLRWSGGGVRRAGVVGVLLSLLATPLVAAAQGGRGTELPRAKPEAVGLSGERLERINALMQRAIESGQVSGAVTVVARRGRVAHFEAHGVKNTESKEPMRRDTLFRMASSTKPVTAVAILMLMEEGKLRLTDPVSRFIPEFGAPKVAVAEAGTTTPRLVPAAREITIRDLLTHTSGLGSGGPGSAQALAVMTSRRPGATLGEVIPRYGAVPLDFHPGSQWRYSGLAGIDVLGRIVEVVSEQTFDEFLRRRIFEPLGMKDTYFVVPEDRRARLATLYRRAGNALERSDPPAILADPAYYSGAGGLISTAEDFARFALMLVNGGELNGRRLLSPRTVDLMGTNHVGDTFVGQLGRPRGMGFGLAVEVVLDGVQADTRRSNGSFGWDGAFGTHFWVDRKERLVGVLMIQTSNRNLQRDFENAVMQAIVE